jgi:hypothetical protein
MTFVITLFGCNTVAHSQFPMLIFLSTIKNYGKFPLLLCQLITLSLTLCWQFATLYNMIAVSVSA